jgi:hypothetical protein
MHSLPKVSLVLAASRAVTVKCIYKSICDAEITGDGAGFLKWEEDSVSCGLLTQLSNQRVVTGFDGAGV